MFSADALVNEKVGEHNVYIIYLYLFTVCHGFTLDKCPNTAPSDYKNSTL